MIPRELRHRLEKAAKILVTIQKHIPDADCVMDPDKGQKGHIQLNFISHPVSPEKFNKLGQELESKGYRFTQKKLPWIGQITFNGQLADMPSVIMTLPHTLDRLEITQGSTAEAYSFAD